MTFFTHAISSSVMSLILTNTPHGNTNLELASIFCSAVLDLDHVTWVVRNRHRIKAEGFYTYMHEARSIFHEPFGALLLGILATILNGVIGHGDVIWVCYLSYLIHVFEDLLFGKSFMIRPFSRRVCTWLEVDKKKIKKIEYVIWIISFGLWFFYLKGYWG